MVAACSGRPNDLRHYGTESATASTLVSPGNVTAVVGTPSTKKIVLPEVLLADSTAADEGFHVTQSGQATVLDRLKACQARLDQPIAAQVGYQVDWVGATPATTLRE